MQASATSEAILLRKSRFSDSGYLLIWLSPQFGKIRTAARAASTAKKTTGLKLPDIFYMAEIQFTSSKKSDLHTLREIRLLEVWDGLRQEYVRLLTASYFAELCDLLSEPGHDAGGLFELLRRGLGYLSEKSPTRRAVEYFEEEVCRLLGFGHGGNALGAIESHAGRIPTNRRRLPFMS